MPRPKFSEKKRIRKYSFYVFVNPLGNPDEDICDAVIRFYAVDNLFNRFYVQSVILLVFN